MATNNPPWQRDELILALDLFFRLNPLRINSSHHEVIKLSETLNSLPIHEGHLEMSKFRNPNGVYMKMCNFLRLDPNYHGAGLKQGSKKDIEVWETFAHNQSYLHQVAQSIMYGYKDLGGQATSYEIEESCPEGKVLYRLHRIRERNRAIVQKAKDLAIRNGEGLKCTVCSFDFLEFYGDLGKGFIECHHTKPIGDYQNEEMTKVTDLSLVCSNCHSMLHRLRPWITPEELKERISRQEELVN